MRHLILSVLLVATAAVAKDKKPKPPKAVYVNVAGKITSKTMLADLQMIDLEDKDGQRYLCSMIDHPDYRFHRFQAGDRVVVTGFKRPDNDAITDCRVGIWESTAATSK